MPSPRLVPSRRSVYSSSPPSPMPCHSIQHGQTRPGSAWFINYSLDISTPDIIMDHDIDPSAMLPDLVAVSPYAGACSRFGLCLRAALDGSAGCRLESGEAGRIRDAEFADAEALHSASPADSVR